MACCDTGNNMIWSSSINIIQDRSVCVMSLRMDINCKRSGGFLKQVQSEPLKYLQTCQKTSSDGNLTGILIWRKARKLALLAHRMVFFEVVIIHAYR